MSTSQEEERKKVEALEWGDVDGWVHHVADLDRDIDVVTGEYERPVSLRRRIEVVSPFISDRVTNSRWRSVFTVAERRLSAQTPYQLSPLSHLGTAGFCWRWSPGYNFLEWVELDNECKRYGGIEFWFENVNVGTTALVTIKGSAAAKQGVTGTVEVSSPRSSDLSPKRFPITGTQEYTFDVIVHPSHADAVAIAVEPKEGMAGFTFNEITYSTV